MYLAIIAALLVLAGLLRRRGTPPTGGTGPVPGLTDEHIRQIEELGAVDVEEPLDMDHIRDEEARFWEESWDEPEEF